MQNFLLRLSLETLVYFQGKPELICVTHLFFCAPVLLKSNQHVKPREQIPEKHYWILRYFDHSNGKRTMSSCYGVFIEKNFKSTVGKDRNKKDKKIHFKY